MSEQVPSIGRIVHYVSYGTPIEGSLGARFTSECRAAIITDLKSDPDEVGLAVLNPTGMFFNTACYAKPSRNFDTPLKGGTWHWPERV